VVSKLPPIDDLESQAKISQLAFDARSHSVGALGAENLDRNILGTLASGELGGTFPIQDHPALGETAENGAAHGELEGVPLNGFFHEVQN